MRNILKNKQNISIQMHDNPDADAITSAYGVSRILEYWGYGGDIIYYGEEITKPSLNMLIKEYQINLINVQQGFELNHDYEVNILVDCQPFETNVHDLKIPLNIIIDHHKQKTDFSDRGRYPFVLINDLVASCSTLIYKMMKDYNIPIDRPLGSALHYGLLMDTNRFSNPLSPLDRDMLDYLEEENLYDKFLINVLIKENLSYDDLGIAHKAIMSYVKDDRFKSLAIVQVEKCEQNLLGYISDTLIETEGVTIVIAFTEEDDSKYRLSIRSCDRFIKANSVIEYVTSKIGGGGGTLSKGGGVIFKEQFFAKHPNHTIRSYIESKTAKIYSKYQKLESGKDTLTETLNNAVIDYTGIPRTLRYLNLSNYFCEKDEVLIRTLEGDVRTNVRNTLVIVGIEGELYPISYETFESRYERLDIREDRGADCDISMKKLKYIPKIKSTKIDKEIEITDIDLPIARKLSREIRALKIQQPVKVITKWDKENPHTGEIGDYLVVNNMEDYYIINKDIFDLLYKVK